MIGYRPAQPCCGVIPTYHLLDEDMHRHFAACDGGTPEAPLIDWAWSRFGDIDGLFVDIGAHVGSWSLPFACAGMNVESFEPNPVIRELLDGAIAENNLELTVHPEALSSTFGTARLTAPGIDGGMACIDRQLNGPVDVEVPVTTLDSFNLAPDIIKVDAEGAELDILRGAYQTIVIHRPTVFFECWEDERGQRRDTLLRFFDDHADYHVERAPWPEMWIAIP